MSGDPEPTTEVTRARALPWERQLKEPLRAWTAFELFLRAGVSRELQSVADALGRKRQTVANMSSRYGWKDRIGAYEQHESKIREEAAAAELVAMAERHANMAVALMGKAAAALKTINTKDVSARDVCLMFKTATEIERFARGALVPVFDPEADVEIMSLEEQQLDNWRRLFVQPEGEFLPHRQQRAAINDDSRFLNLVAGVQSGKTAGAAIGFWRRVLRDRPKIHSKGDVGFYWLIAPNSIVGEVMCEAFEQFAPPGEIMRARGAASGRTWELRDGTRVQFRSGEHADKLVGRRVHGCWLDEFTILKREVWVVSVRQRLATTGGWCIFSGTPRGRNWAYEDVWRRGQPGDDLYDPEYAGYTWPSVENPAVDPREVELARRQLPEAFFRREWEASWEAFHGQIYEDWVEKRHAVKGLSRQPIPNGVEVYMGVDWGTSNPGCSVVGLRLPNGEWRIVDEVYEAGKLPGWWTKQIAAQWGRWKAAKVFCDPAEPGLIGELINEGIPAEGAPNAVLEGIRQVASLIKQNLIRVDTECKHLVRQHGDYHWKESRGGIRYEAPAKENDHAVDAERYMIMGRLTQRAPGRVTGYGGAR